MSTSSKNIHENLIDTNDKQKNKLKQPIKKKIKLK